MNNMKPLSSRRIEELVDLHTKLQIDLPELNNKGKYVKKDLLATLEAAGVTNRKLKALETKEAVESTDKSNTVNPAGMAVVCMDRSNASFAYKKYKFTQVRKYVVMPNDEADELISENTGFRKASGEEVRRYYNERNLL